MKFLLIDRITQLTSQQSISAVKNLTLAEEYLADHFPGFPVLPGVLMLEALTQTGAWLIRVSENFAHSTITLKETKAVRYNHFVAPGDQLVLQMTLKKQTDNLWDFQASGTVHGDSAISAKLTLQAVNLADSNPALAATDAQLIQYYQNLLPQLWKQPTVAETQSSAAVSPA